MDEIFAQTKLVTSMLEHVVSDLGDGEDDNDEDVVQGIPFPPGLAVEIVKNLKQAPLLLQVYEHDEYSTEQ
ncbi:hypothetical protein RJ639_035504 [Escallonia herrerae]|uniref:Uncharacterized protein n=1 Tax=Escallonia herrerae TaxID=1293975 RepID=A0AA88WS48_9ASTE|nr:hypothetical protein RJ639_035504 [Escallonia herrerae]